MTTAGVDHLHGNKIRLTVLVENSVAFPFLSGNLQGLLGEHGLAVLVDNGREQILYDTGRGRTLLGNIEQSGYRTDQIGKIVISHGHRDHTGALLPLLQKRGKTEIFCHPGIFDKKYGKTGSRMNYIGVPFTLKELEEAGGVFHYAREPLALGEGIVLSGPIPRIHEWEQSDGSFFIEDGDRFVRDGFEDEQAVFIRSESGLVIITGCGHAGIINTVEHALSLLGTRKILAIVGGLHLAGVPAARLKLTIAHLKRFEIDQFVVGHCTGFEAMCCLQREFMGKVVPLSAGKQLDFQMVR